ncbi:MAG: UbiA family prenyltransferase [Planctomycetes bacterium]|nr:UbiA family prenyltransferase [Planctomycetota bacterium]
MSSPRWWHAYWVTLRPYLFFVSGASGLVGLALTPSPSWLAFTAFFFSYGLGQALTDCFQRDTDAISSPYRPLTRGLITPRQVLAVSLIGLGLCGAIVVALNPWNAPLSLLGVAGLATYTPFKRRWWGGPPWNSWIVALLPAMGFLCGVSDPRAALGNASLGAAMLSVFFTYAVFVILGYHKDINADRATGYDTIPVRFGWGSSVLASFLCALAGLAASGWALWRAQPRVSAWALALIGAILLVAAHAVMMRTRDEKRAYPAIELVVRGYVLVHLGEAVAFRPILMWPAMGFYALFEMALALRPSRAQV